MGILENYLPRINQSEKFDRNVEDIEEIILQRVFQTRETYWVMCFNKNWMR